MIFSVLKSRLKFYSKKKKKKKKKKKRKEQHVNIVVKLNLEDRKEKLSFISRIIM